MAIYSNKISIQATENQPILEITDYNVSILCFLEYCCYQISVTGTVLYKGKPLPNWAVSIGFCSDYNPTTHTFTSSTLVGTDENGKFSSTGLTTQTPPGGQNCIATMVYYNNMYADKMMTATVPSC